MLIDTADCRWSVGKVAQKKRREPKVAPAAGGQLLVPVEACFVAVLVSFAVIPAIELAIAVARVVIFGRLLISPLALEIIAPAMADIATALFDPLVVARIQSCLTKLERATPVRVTVPIPPSASIAAPTAVTITILITTILIVAVALVSIITPIAIVPILRLGCRT